MSSFLKGSHGTKLKFCHGVPSLTENMYLKSNYCDIHPTMLADFIVSYHLKYKSSLNYLFHDEIMMRT